LVVFNQIYDANTFIALKDCGIHQVIDGYGLMPYIENEISFIPQLFEKILILPFGVQSTKLHLHSWKKQDFINFEIFIKKNSNKVITYDEALKKINNNLFYKVIRFFTKKILKLKRIRLKQDSEFNIKKA